MAHHEGNTILDSAEIRAMELNNKMDTITLHHGKTAKNIIIEWVLWKYGIHTLLLPINWF